jgi:exonuclease VII large subunit
MLTRDRREIIASMHDDVKRINNLFNTKVDELLAANRDEIARVGQDIVVRITTVENEIAAQCKILDQLNPEKVLERGYSLLRGNIEVGNVVEITTFKQDINAKITEVKER